MARLLITGSVPRVEIDRGALSAFLTRAVSVLGLPSRTVLELRLVSRREVCSLKARIFDAAHETDVIALPVFEPAIQGRGPVLVGEVVLCPEVIAANARSLGRTFGDEMLFCFTHGLLHLVGWDDSGALARRRMFAEQERVIAASGARRSSGRSRADRMFRWRSS